MNRPIQFSETAVATVVALELKEPLFNAQATNLELDVAKQPAELSLQVEWDDFDTGTLDD